MPPAPPPDPPLRPLDAPLFDPPPPPPPTESMVVNPVPDIIESLPFEPKED